MADECMCALGSIIIVVLCIYMCTYVRSSAFFFCLLCEGYVLDSKFDFCYRASFVDIQLSLRYNQFIYQL